VGGSIQPLNPPETWPRNSVLGTRNSVSHEALACYLFSSTSAPHLPATTTPMKTEIPSHSVPFIFWQSHLRHLQTTRLWHDLKNFDDTFISRAYRDRFHGQNMCGKPTCLVEGIILHRACGVRRTSSTGISPAAPFGNKQTEKLDLLNAGIHINICILWPNLLVSCRKFKKLYLTTGMFSICIRFTNIIKKIFIIIL